VRGGGASRGGAVNVEDRELHVLDAVSDYHVKTTSERESA
jgi:hypothetical protein